MIFATDEQEQKFNMVFNETFLLRNIDDSLEIFINSTKPEVFFKFTVNFYDEGVVKKDQCWCDENSCILNIHKRYEQTEEELSRLLDFDVPGRRLYIQTSRSIIKHPMKFSITAWATVYVGDSL